MLVPEATSCSELSSVFHVHAHRDRQLTLVTPFQSLSLLFESIVWMNTPWLLLPIRQIAANRFPPTVWHKGNNAASLTPRTPIPLSLCHQWQYGQAIASGPLAE